MFLNKFSDWPNNKKIKQLLIFSVILLLVIYPIMSYFFTVSYPVSAFESQLSFSGELIKEYNTNADINLYKIANILDYFFILSYGGISFSLGVIIARKFKEEIIWRKIGLIMIPLTIIAPSCDAIENIFILLMLSDPLEFPNVWAIIHSFFALLKYIIMFIGFGWIATALIYLVFIRKSHKI
ncbi:MAG: hypothetical protein ACFFC3_02195 [Candidatus Odinarchaeota archaeon]